MRPILPRPRGIFILPLCIACSCRIIFCMSRNWFSKRLISCTDVPLPAAMRFLRLALITSGWRRSLRRHAQDDRFDAFHHFVIDAGLRGFAGSLFMPGIISSILSIGPIFFISFICNRKSSKSKLPFFMRASISSIESPG